MGAVTSRVDSAEVKLLKLEYETKSSWRSRVAGSRERGANKFGDEVSDMVSRDSERSSNIKSYKSKLARLIRDN